MDERLLQLDEAPELFADDVPGEPSAVDLRHVQEHPYEKDPKKKRGCNHRDRDGLRCGKAKDAMLHVGVPQSLNVHGSSAHWYSYQAMKHNWSERLGELLERTDLPKALGYVYAEGQACFPDRRARDQGNFRFILEKALGDVLVDRGYLENDDWSRYEFGNLRRAYEKGVSWTAVTIFPSWHRREV